MTLAEAIRSRLLQLMKEKDFSAYDFYVKGGLAKSTVSQILNGTRGEKMAVKTLYEMISTMSVSLKDFFDDGIFDGVTD